MATKICSKCKAEKEVSMFYKKKLAKAKFRSQCKKCMAEFNKHYRQTEKRKRAVWKYNRSEKGRKCDRKSVDKYHERYPERRKAVNAVNNAIRSGNMERELCETDRCYNVGQAHHDDYNKPFQVRWLCSKHHSEHHRVGINEINYITKR